MLAGCRGSEQEMEERAEHWSDNEDFSVSTYHDMSWTGTLIRFPKCDRVWLVV